ncbi:MAG: NAD(P)-dependent oxidoreductase [Peptococcales bacterium]|jgi:2-hydroxy-3-oxopropionate reductase
MTRIGFIGVGIMGKPMCKNLLKKGFQVTVIAHKNIQPVEELKEMGASVATSRVELANNSDVLITVLPGPKEVEEVCFGEDSIVKGLKPGSIYIDMSTSSPALSKEICKRLTDYGVKMLDAPISRGVPAAEKGTLITLVGGEEKVLDECRHVLEAMASDILHMGPIGSGHSAKLVNNVKIMTEMVLICESLALGLKSGIEPQKLFDAISLSSGNSFYFQYKVPRMLKGEFEPGGSVDIGFKDIYLALEWAREIGVPMLLPALAQQVYQTAREKGLSGKDNASIIKIYEELLDISMCISN